MPLKINYSYNYKGCLVFGWGDKIEVCPPMQYVKPDDEGIFFPADTDEEEVKMFIDLMFA